MKECGQQQIFLVDHHLPNNKNLIMNHNFAKSAMKTSINNRGCSSVGRASGLHPEGRRFDSYQLHQHLQYMKRFRNGLNARYKFPNGYEASIVCHDGSYGGKNNLFEIAIMIGDNIIYDTPITQDVLGHLTWDEVEENLWRIKDL